LLCDQFTQGLFLRSQKGREKHGEGVGMKNNRNAWDGFITIKNGGRNEMMKNYVENDTS